MRPWIGVAAFAVGYASVAYAEGNVRPIPFIAKSGDTARVSIAHERNDERAYETKSSNVKLVYQAEIVGETKEGYKLTWRPTSLTAKGQTVDTTTERPEIDQDIALEFETDNSGMPLALVNYVAVRENNLRAAEAAGARYSEEIRKKTRAMFENVSPETAAGMWGKYAQLIGFFQGFSLELGKPKAYQDQLGNPIGPGSFNTNASITLTSIDEKNDTATLEWRQTADPVSFKKMMAEMFKSVAPDKPVDQKKLDALKFDTTYTATANVRLSDGWLTTLRYETLTLANDGKDDLKRTERYTITVER